MEIQQMLSEIETAAKNKSSNEAYASHSKKYAITQKIMQQIYVISLMGTHR